jgi:hypothetical protein
MSLSEQEKNNLVNDGKFTLEQVDFFNNNGLRYNIIKLLQGVLHELLETQNRVWNQESSLALENINTHVYHEIQVAVDKFQRASSQRRARSSSTINDYVMATIQFITTQIMDLNMSSDESEDSGSVGGKRKRQRSKSQRRRSRRRAMIRKSRRV